MSAAIDLEKFYDCFVQALGVDREDLDMDKTLLDELGADSLDLLDLIFNLEQAFEITIPRGEFERQAREQLGDTPFEINGVLTDEGAAALKAGLPEAADKIKPGMRTHQIPMLFTVRSFHRLVEDRVAAAV